MYISELGGLEPPYFIGFEEPAPRVRFPIARSTFGCLGCPWRSPRTLPLPDGYQCPRSGCTRRIVLCTTQDRRRVIDEKSVLPPASSEATLAPQSGRCVRPILVDDVRLPGWLAILLGVLDATGSAIASKAQYPYFRRWSYATHCSFLWWSLD